MPLRHFEFYSLLVKVMCDDDDLPEGCEVYDKDKGIFVEREDLLPEVWFDARSRLISPEEFERLLAEAQKKER